MDTSEVDAGFLPHLSKNISDLLQRKYSEDISNLLLNEEKQLQADIAKLYFDQKYKDQISTTDDGKVDVQFSKGMLALRVPNLFDLLETNRWHIDGPVEHVRPSFEVISRFVYLGEQPQRSASIICAVEHSLKTGTKLTDEQWSSVRNGDDIFPQETHLLSSAKQLTWSDKEAVALGDLGKSLYSGLLKEENLSDIILTANSTAVAAHRFILSARSQFFENMLYGPWAEGGASAVPIKGISDATLKLVLQYIYGVLPTKWSLEVFQAADMFSLPGLLNCMVLLLKRDKCHYFLHKPCRDCGEGLTEVLHLGVRYEHVLTDLLPQTYQHMGRHFCRMAAERCFSTLPQEVLDRCHEAVKNSLSRTSVVTTTLDVQYLIFELKSAKRPKNVIELAENLNMSCLQYIADHMGQILSDDFYSKNKSRALGLDLVENIFTEAIPKLPLDTSCQVYEKLDKLKPQEDWPEEYSRMMAALKKSCLRYICLHIAQIMKSPGWKTLPEETQQHLQSSAGFVMVLDPPPKRIVHRPPRQKIPPRKGVSPRHSSATKTTLSQPRKTKELAKKLEKKTSPNLMQMTPNEALVSSGSCCRGEDNRLEDFSNLEDACSLDAAGACPQNFNYNRAYTVPSKQVWREELLPMLTVVFIQPSDITLDKH